MCGAMQHSCSPNMTTTVMSPKARSADQTDARAVARESYAGDCKTQGVEAPRDSDFARLYNDFDRDATLGNQPVSPFARSTVGQ